MAFCRVALAALCLPALIVPAAGATKAGVPGKLGQCVRTTIRHVGQRLEDGATGEAIAGSGSQVVLANGVTGVSYRQVPAVDRSRAGDPVRTCLVRLPQGCPPGDTRGKWYKSTNLRTHKTWTLPDAGHMCGGA